MTRAANALMPRYWCAKGAASAGLQDLQGRGAAAAGVGCNGCRGLPVESPGQCSGNAQSIRARAPAAGDMAAIIQVFKRTLAYGNAAVTPPVLPAVGVPAPSDNCPTGHTWDTSVTSARSRNVTRDSAATDPVTTAADRLHRLCDRPEIPQLTGFRSRLKEHAHG